ncbi:MAG: valine--tRNA ligase [Johnsonella sp.]|nr:valine--tRNA ligase [Johnsonella sp.]
MKELNKTYEPSEIEGRIYDKWMRKKYFHAKVNPDKKPFTIVMPPPNITGSLHMGHALDNTMQDILIRYKRMQGFEALWQPGTDHAAIATEVKVIDKLKSEGRSKEELGREGFLDEAWKWRQEYGSRIIHQLHRLGSSADWDRERFTMDEGCSDAVKEVFIRLFEKGYIYKGSRIINFCPLCHTSISDAEVEHIDAEGSFWHIRYPIEGEEGSYVEIATTRPETMLGDTAVAVNPKDKRYRNLIGKMLLLPLTGRKIPLIEDEYVDQEFGTGCVKITPAHDPNDFEVGKRHDLPVISIMDDEARIHLEGSPYHGMDRYEARKAIVRDLEKEGYLVKILPHSHSVGTHDRCKTVVEPMVKPQWFVRMEEMAKPAIEAIHNQSLRFVPESFSKTYLHWLENIKDWCISRQLWWGHRIPAYYCSSCGELRVEREKPECCAKCGCKEFIQDEDTLDTWFSSALWPFSTLGWPNSSEEMDYFYPTDVLVTGYDIIFFWVVRMVFSGIEQTGKTPFHTVLIHGLVRDSQGRKMSKSLGNGIDPLEIIDRYGADALRMTLITGNAPGNDMRFYIERVEASRNFANKIWNASRFIMMHMEEDSEGREKASLASLRESALFRPEDRWMFSKLNALIKEVTDNLDKYELGIALSKIYDFSWEEYCDWYIEMLKPRIWNKEDRSRPAALFALREVLRDLLKLLHPFMPFITEEIYCNLFEDEESIMVSQWPKHCKEGEDPAALPAFYREEERAVETIKEVVKSIRGVRSSMNVPPSRKITVCIVSKDEQIRKIFEESREFFAALAGAEKLLVQEDKEGIASDALSAFVPGADIYLPLEDLVDIKKEIERLEKEEKKMEAELARVRGMLGNPSFVGKAPAAKIEEERAKLEKYEAMMEQIKKQLSSFRERDKA